MLYISVFSLCIYTRQLERIYFLFHAENSTIKQWTIIASEWERSNYLLLYRTSERRENASHWVSIMSTSTQGSTQQQQHATTTATTITQTTATATISRTMQYTVKSLTRVYTRCHVDIDAGHSCACHIALIPHLYIYCVGVFVWLYPNFQLGNELEVIILLL